MPIISYRNAFKADVPYTLDTWLDGCDLKEIEDCREKLNKAYSKIIKLIENKDFEKFKNYLKKREQNMATSMYLSNEESRERVGDLIEDFNSGFVAKPIPEDSLMIFGGDNKVAFLKKVNGEPALSFENATTEEELMLDISFCIPKRKSDFEVI